VTTFTQNLKLNVPEFDQTPWDAEVNSNWSILDATVGMFTAIPNLAGVWVNSKAYLVGQSVIDATDSSIWYCLVGHTTPPPPTLFSTDRTLNPARWTQTSGGAQFYAQQAADAAAQAVDAANDAQAAVDSIPDMLPLAGGTMTGEIILSGDPVSLLGAAPKQYVDARVGGTGYLPISGGTLTGSLTVGGNGIRYSVISGGNDREIAFGWTGSYLYINVDGVYSGAVATREFAASNYLPLSGGTVTGTLFVQGQLQTYTRLLITFSGMRLDTDSNFSSLMFDSNGWQLIYNRSNNSLEYQRGGDNVVLFLIDHDGNGYVARSFTAYGALEVDGSVFARGGTVFWGASDRSKLITDNSSYTQVQFLDNYLFFFNWSNAALSWRVPGGESLKLWSGGDVGNERGGVYGYGPYSNLSDERTKFSIWKTSLGLHEIMQIEPIMFKRKLESPDECGFSAQQVQKVIPYAVHKVGEDHEFLSVSLDPIVAALVNGMKELAVRMNKLENS
jgi:hypothetical protein